ncbi:SusC/RagA family TonB-linked outer membrane protein [Marinifilum breve]|uniref:SusC/RagA family TonB-linked outer membrane protein n=2 Tax=Marinifilum breve TaxID=2184082 RepID=A0A2V3ZZK7_9BACT|nr:SusC/RagA family TonB-linked outer membrane protein [Marinifilum breve]
MKKNLMWRCMSPSIRKTLLVMKLSFILILVGSLQLSASVLLGQQVSVQAKTSLVDVLEDLNNQTGTYFMYNVNEIDDEIEVQLDMQDASLEEVLNEICKQAPVNYEIVEDFVIITKKDPVPVIKEEQEKKELKGKVTDKDGIPLPGVSVVIKGSSTGVATDIDGNYTLEVEDENAVLIFSFVGMLPQERNYTGQLVLNVELFQDTEGLEEVVVIGYGTITRERSTGATTKVDPVILKNTQNVSYADALIGIVPGMYVEESFSNPDSSPDIILRGIGSISGEVSPLVVVDGVQMPNGFNSSAINSSDIEEISVLKDAASTAIYGSRGSNGVIIINTKRGKKNSKPQVSFNASFGTKRPDKSFRDDIMNASEKLSYEESLGLYPTDDAAAQALLAERRASGNDVDWSNLMLDNEMNQKYDLSIAGGNEKMNYYTSLSYNKVDNIYGSNYERYTASLKFDFEIAKNLTLGLSGTYGNVNNKDRRVTGSPVSNAFLLNPWEEVYDENGDPLRNLSYATNSYGVAYNPLFIRDNTDIKSIRRNVTGNARLTYKPLDWLTLNGNIGGNYNHSKGHNYEKIIIEGGQLTVTNGDNNNVTGTLTASIDKEFDQHSVNVVMGTEFIENEIYSYYGHAKEFLSDAVQIINSAKNIDTQKESKSESGGVSYFTRLNYSYANTYNFTASIRRDGSSRFGDKHKWGNFWALGGSWNIHKNIDKEKSALSTLKLRGSIGTSGNDRIGDFASVSLYDFRESYDGSDVATLNRGDNPELTWEKNKNRNIGLDVGLWRNKLYVTLDFYIRDTYDLINDVQIPLQSGFQNLTSNIGDFRNKGYEISIRSTNFSTKNFMWSTNFNFSYNKSEIRELIEDDRIIELGTVAYKKGNPIASLYLAEWAGVNPETGYNMYVNPDATGADDLLIEYQTNVRTPNESDITASRRVTNKTGNPKYFGGFTNTFRYKNFDASVLISFAGGHYVVNSANHQLRNDVWMNQHKDVNNAWKQAGDQSQLAVRALNYWQPLTRRVDSDYQNSTQFLQDADYVKLKNLTIGYTLDNSLSSKVGIDKLRFYVQAQNLFTITDVDYIDPEYATMGGVGLSSTVLRGYSFGISANF